MSSQLAMILRGRLPVPADDCLTVPMAAWAARFYRTQLHRHSETFAYLYKDLRHSQRFEEEVLPRRKTEHIGKILAGDKNHRVYGSDVRRERLPRT